MSCLLRRCGISVAVLCPISTLVFPCLEDAEPMKWIQLECGLGGTVDRSFSAWLCVIFFFDVVLTSRIVIDAVEGGGIH